MTQTVDVVGVVGAGFMGSGIAHSAAAAGKRVLLHEPSKAPLDRSRAALEATLARAVERGRVSEQDAAATTRRITYTTTLEDLAEATSRPERVIGLHFFSPVPLTKLVEVVASPQTAPETVAAAEMLARELGKEAIRVPDRAGFIVNALLIPYLADAIRMLERGLASAQDIDTGMTLGCGHPMGPLALCDFIGLDVVAAICATLHEELGEERYRAPELLVQLVAEGRLGRKTGRGFYDHAGARR